MAAFRCIARALLRRPLAANSMTTYKRNNARGFLRRYSRSKFRCRSPEDCVVCRQAPLISLRTVLKLKGSAQHLSNETTNESQCKGHMVMSLAPLHLRCWRPNLNASVLGTIQLRTAEHKWRQAWTPSPQFNIRRLEFLAR